MTLLIGFDDTPAGRDALALGLQLAGSTHEAPTVVTVYPDEERGVMVAIHDHTWRDEVRAAAEAKLAKAREIIGDRFPGITYEAIGPTSAARGLHELSEELNAALVVVGSTEHAAVGRIAPGSTVQRLLHGSPCPVAVAPRGYRKRGEVPLRRFGVAYDGSTEAQDALDVAVQLAQRVGASLRLVAVAGRPNESLQAELDKAVASVPVGVQATGEVVIDDDVADTLADLPGPEVDVVICGSRGYGPVRQVLLGGVTTRLLRSAAYPVIVVPRGSTRHAA